jgi:hypothetical protein
MSSLNSCDCNGNCRRQVVNEESSAETSFHDHLKTESPKSPEPRLINEEFPCYTQSFLEEENDNAMDIPEDIGVLKRKDCEELNSNDSPSLIEVKPGEKDRKKRRHYTCTADIYGECTCTSEDDSDLDEQSPTLLNEESPTLKCKAVGLHDNDVSEIERRKAECAEYERKTERAEYERYNFLKDFKVEMEKRKSSFKIAEFYINEIQKLSGIV